MSFVILKVPHNGSRAVTIPYERAAAMQAVMDGRQKPQNDAQAAFIANVASVHLGSQHTAQKPSKQAEGSEPWWQK